MSVGQANQTLEYPKTGLGDGCGFLRMYLVVDHLTLTHSHGYATEYQNKGGTFGLTALDVHATFSPSTLATRYLPRSKKTHMQHPTEIRP